LIHFPDAGEGREGKLKISELLPRLQMVLLKAEQRRYD
jgi:hypothetical protein